MLSKVNNFITQNNLINPNDKILLAVSGGKDSVFMVDVLFKIKNILNFEIGIAHINHQIRKNSLNDELFVQNLAKKYNLPFFCIKLNLQNLNSNIESIARTERYNSLQQIADENNYNKIATAHSQNDNIETFFIKLYRGTSIEGLESINLIKNNIIRPILNITTEEIYEYLKINNLDYVFDESNDDTKFLRNYIRHNLIPNIDIENYSIKTHILNLIEQVKNQNEYFEKILNNLFKSNLYKIENMIIFDKKCFDFEDNFIKFKILNRILNKYFYLSVDTNKLNLIINSLNKNELIQIEKNINISSDSGFIVFEQNQRMLNIESFIYLLPIISLNGFWSFGNTNFEDLISKLDDYELVVFKDGDKFKKYNKSIVKIKDIFINHKVPKFLRKVWPMIKYNNEIIAIPYIEKGYFFLQ